MYERQDGKCYICKKEIELGGKGKAAVDHNHLTGKVRAILCFSCNTLVGHLESPTREAADAYLQEFGQ